MQSTLRRGVVCLIILIAVAITGIHIFHQRHTADGGHVNTLRTEHSISETHNGTLYPTRSLTKRAPPATFQQAVQSGINLMKEVNAPIDCVKQSTWTSYDDFEDYGWVLKKNDPVDLHLGLFAPLWSDWNLPSGPGQTMRIRWYHVKSSLPHYLAPNGDVYHYTEGSFTSVYNPGIIIAESNYSPAFRGSRLPKNLGGPVTGDYVIPFKQFSDITFVQWQQFCNNDPQRMQALKGMMRASIANPDTRKIADEALSRTGKTLDLWPNRVEFTMDSAEGQALLATPNGLGAAWFVAQHKKQLGGMTITKVVVWAKEDPSRKLALPLCLLFVFEPGTDAGQGQASKRRRGMVGNVPKALERDEGYESGEDLHDLLPMGL